MPSGPGRRSTRESVRPKCVRPRSYPGPKVGEVDTGPFQRAEKPRLFAHTGSFLTVHFLHAPSPWTEVQRWLAQHLLCRVGYGGALCTAGEEGLSLPCTAHLTLQIPLQMQHLTLQYQAAQAPDASTLARLPGQGPGLLSNWHLPHCFP